MRKEKLLCILALLFAGLVFIELAITLFTKANIGGLIVTTGLFGITFLAMLYDEEQLLKKGKQPTILFKKWVCEHTYETEQTYHQGHTVYLYRQRCTKCNKMKIKKYVIY